MYSIAPIPPHLFQHLIMSPLYVCLSSSAMRFQVVSGVPRKVSPRDVERKRFFATDEAADTVRLLNSGHVSRESNDKMALSSVSRPRFYTEG
jgi:hypothetical protein